MLDRIRGEQAGPWIIIGAVVLLATVLFAILIINSYVYEAVYHDYATTKQEAEHQRQFREKCANLTTVEDLRRCFEQQIKTSRETQRAEEDLYAQKQMANWALWMVAISGAIGVITILITLVAVAYVIKTYEETRKSAAATIAAAKAAEESAAISRDTAQRQLRAYMAVDSPEGHFFEFIPNSGSRPYFRVRLRWRNNGATPARNLILYTAWNIFPDPLPPNFNFSLFRIAPRNRERVVTFGPIIASPHRHVFSPYVFIPWDDLLMVKERRCAVYLWGWAEYYTTVTLELDGRPKRHRVEFCFTIFNNALPNLEPRIEIHTYDWHNAEDEDCLNRPMTK